MLNATDPAADLRARLLVLRQRLDADLSRVTPLRAVAQRRLEIDELVTDLDRQLARVQRAAVVTLVGATGAGKSTLLNALAGRSIALEGVDRPTTRRPVIYAPPDADLATLLEDTVAHPAGHESEGGPLIVRHNSTGPGAGYILIDAPDLNSIDLQHRATVIALAQRSDALLVVLHHQSVVEAASVSFIDAFSERRRLLFVLNRADELTEASRRQLLAQVRDLADHRWGAAEAPVLSLSARAGQGKPDEPDWTNFQRTLAELVSDSAITTVRRLNAIGCGIRLQKLFDVIEGETAPDLSALADDVAAGSDALQSRVLLEISARLGLRRPDLTDRLCSEAAARWEGPGGWALRAGAVGTLGAGLGAALLRRHPLVAAGAATGTMAADRLQADWRDRRITDATGLSPARTDFDGWYVETLGAARLRASRLAGSPAAFDVPAADAVYAQLAMTAEDAWGDLVDRDIPAAAERSVLRFLRLPLDLPVYALAAWVVYRVAGGFVAGTYTGVDFLVNAALLLLAYMLPLRLVVRRSLAWRARRLLRDVHARLARTLDAHAAARIQAVRRSGGEVQAALERLRALEDTWRAELTGLSNCT